MDHDLIFQLIASTVAMIFSAASLASWLFNTETIGQKGWSRKPLIFTQIIIGGIIILGSIASMVLAVKRVTSDDDLSRAMSPVQAGIVLLLLIVNEYLCISTLLSHLTHIIAGFFLFCAIIVLALIIYQPSRLYSCAVYPFVV
ncbi:hypothetical protein N7451_009067 [Penicillium sp. IBT 35674x]|nr:hypothetical protein N7451_009067 [Penicillium sp. IBT 35674x]